RSCSAFSRGKGLTLSMSSYSQTTRPTRRCATARSTSSQVRRTPSFAPSRNVEPLVQSAEEIFSTSSAKGSSRNARSRQHLDRYQRLQRARDTSHQDRDRCDGEGRTTPCAGGIGHLQPGPINSRFEADRPNYFFMFSRNLSQAAILARLLSRALGRSSNAHRTDESAVNGERHSATDEIDLPRITCS